MLQTKEYPHYALACVKVWLYPPILMRQIRFFYDYRGQPIGYVTWAFLSDDVVDKLKHDPRFILHDSEWNEGCNVWIMDFVAISGYARDLVGKLAESEFLDCALVKSARRRTDGTLGRVSNWRRRSIGEAPVHD
ncbi:toxin-activating lysine-acyltransferase [Xanthomonas perforans]|nr:toxin-activating lysine-acyltransferase [Xanthomonas perforans]RXD37469.1 toxin-activating lysine-acyltransferase [Xanthomonas perforans]RXD39321.1 toxin-activating lysine-acyltransferase [Xanthomonas perforans]RXD49515.1 toxin-activating lysine-acyltransferase [Xanthomonas perforans]RXD53304.1 toxin-activating lysine-acyltransferase [Xanthomonas perforans]